MVQWINFLRDSSFVNLTQLPLMCKNSLAIVKPGPWPLGRQKGNCYNVRLKSIMLQEFLIILSGNSF